MNVSGKFLLGLWVLISLNAGLSSAQVIKGTVLVDIDLAIRLIEQEERLSANERARLLLIVEIFKNTVQATTADLGHPWWIE
jgi:hypothetical protein